MKIPKAILWSLFAVVAAGILYGTILIRRGFSTKDQPSLLETGLARMARGLSIPSSAKDTKNPYAATAENVTAGRKHYADHCAICHSNDGSGQTEIGPNLYPKPPDMRLERTQSLSDGEIFYIINNGVRLTGMPGWGASHIADDSWKLVLFIRHLPQLSAEEKNEMEHLNHGGADEDEERSKGGEHHHHE